MNQAYTKPKGFTRQSSTELRLTSSHLKLYKSVQYLIFHLDFLACHTFKHTQLLFYKLHFYTVYSSVTRVYYYYVYFCFQQNTL